MGTWEGEGRKERLQKDIRKLWGMMDMFIFLIVAMVSQGKRQNIKFYTLNMYSICIMIFISYSSVKLFKMLESSWKEV